MFTVERRGLIRKAARLSSDAKLEPADFLKVAEELGEAPKTARKSGFVSAKQADTTVRIETRWNGKESEIVAQPGDWIATSLTGAGEVMRDDEGYENSYVIKHEKFKTLYEPATGETRFGKIFRPLGVVQTLYFPAGFDIVAPWGERQRAKAGYLLLNGNDVYGNNKQTFEATYKVMG